MENNILPAATTGDGEIPEPVLWPDVLAENFADGSWPDLSSEVSDESVEAWVQQNGKILLRTVTWNLCAEPPPVVGDIQENLLPKDRFHVYIIGTEECERSIAQSALFPSKKGWEAYLNEAMGPNYVPIRSHTLQAIHLMAFVHRGIAHLCSAVTSAAVPTGMGSTLGNKGGVGLYFKIGTTRFLVVNAHLAAHQTAEKRRNAEFNRINKMIPVFLQKRGAQFAPTNLTIASKETFSIREGGNASVAGNDVPAAATTENENGAPPTVPAAQEEYEPRNASDTQLATNADSTIDTNAKLSHDMRTPLLISASTHSITHSVDLSAQHTIPAVETIVDKTGHVMGEVDECYTVEAMQAEDEQHKQDQAVVEAAPNGANNVAVQASTEPVGQAQEGNNKPSLALDVSNPATNNPENSKENSNTEAAVGSAVDLNNSTLGSQIDSFTPVAHTPTTARPLGAVSTNNSSQAIDALADENNNDGDVNMKNRLDGTAILDVPKNATKTLENSADLVVFMGDLNYRIKGNRKIVSSLVANNMHEVLLHNDQLGWNMSKGLVLQGFTEGPLNFRPTYKYDIGTEHYDTSSKGRIPSWTDRILFVPRPGAVQCLAYQSDDSVRTSDHRPVFASFQVAVDVSSSVTINGAGSRGAGTRSSGMFRDLLSGVETQNPNSPTAPVFTSESQVCTIM